MKQPGDFDNPMNQKLPPGQLAEENRKRRAGHHKTDCCYRREDDALWGFVQQVKIAYEAWCRRRGFPLPSEHRQLMNDASYRKAKRFLDQQETE